MRQKVGPRYSVGKLVARRGAGLGNEVIPWAKAYLGSAVFEAKLLRPPWIINPRRYDIELESSPATDLARYLYANSRRGFNLTTNDVWSTGCVDYYDALVQLAPRIRDSGTKILLHTSGMSFGYLGIARARPFLQGQVLGTYAAVAAIRDLDEAVSSSIRVGVHVRGGDFASSESINEGSFNTALPINWYVNQIHTLQQQLSGDITVVLLGAREHRALLKAQLRENVRVYEPMNSATGDIAVLSACDLIIPSVSSFSMLAIFLSDAPYTWPKEHLTRKGNYLSIWGGERHPAIGSEITRSVQGTSSAADIYTRGHPQSVEPVWEPLQISQVHTAREHRLRSQNDLIQFGSVRVRDPLVH